MEVNDLTKRQAKTIKSIGRYAGGYSSSSNATVTHKQLQFLGLLKIESLGVQLTPEGIEISKALLK
jgi:hypothetical protein